MNRQESFLTGAGVGACLGAGLMYLFDPEAGARRRARLRDRLTGLLRQAGNSAVAPTLDLANQTAGGSAQKGATSTQAGVTSPGSAERMPPGVGPAVPDPATTGRTVGQGRSPSPNPPRRGEVDRESFVAGVGVGACLGAGLMYLFDPEAGPRRRARLRDRLRGLWGAGGVAAVTGGGKLSSPEGQAAPPRGPVFSSVPSVERAPEQAGSR